MERDVEVHLETIPGASTRNLWLRLSKKDVLSNTLGTEEGGALPDAGLGIAVLDNAHLSEHPQQLNVVVPSHGHVNVEMVATWRCFSNSDEMIHIQPRNVHRARQ